MSARAGLREIWHDWLCAIQFLTRVPVRPPICEQDSLARAVKFFPLVGGVIGGSAALVHAVLAPHLPPTVTAIAVVAFVGISTGLLHEDGLADVADGFGGGISRDRVLEIMRDSRIGTYGSAALALSLLARVLLIAAMTADRVGAYLIAAHVLCRWTTLPLSCFLAPARKSGGGQGARIARLTTRGSLVIGSLLALVIVLSVLRARLFAPILVSLAVTLFSGYYYNWRIGGVTGDCFGATNQLAEIAVYLCGVWI